MQDLVETYGANFESNRDFWTELISGQRSMDMGMDNIDSLNIHGVAVVGRGGYERLPQSVQDYTEGLQGGGIAFMRSMDTLSQYNALLQRSRDIGRIRVGA